MNKFIYLTLIAATFMVIADLIPIDAKYKQAFADKTICLTERVSLLDYLALGTKEGFVKYGH